MYYKLSFILPFVLITLLGKPVQGFFNMVIILSSLYSFAFIDTNQWMYLYLIGVTHSILLIFFDHQSKKNSLLNKIAHKIINE